MHEAERKNLFENTSVFKAIARLAVPTMIGQIILVIYNMADTFFVGQTGSDAMLAGVTVCMPAFMLLSAISNLFGVGGASAISRSLGRRETGRAYRCASFSFYGCLVTTLLYSLGVFLLIDPFVDLLGGSHSEVHSLAAEYLTVTVVLGGTATAMNALLAHLLRSEGRSFHAAIGVILGGLLNIALDPLFMFVILPRGREVFGAALATSLSNVIALLYYVAVLAKGRHKSVLRFIPEARALADGIPAEILSVGLPAFMMTTCENVSYAVMDALTAGHGLIYQAGLGVAKKINMLAHCAVRGIAQGALPLIAYNCAAGNDKRMKDAIRLTSVSAVAAATVCMVISLSATRPLVEAFIHTQAAAECGEAYLRILCLGCPFSALAYVMISFFQAVKEGKTSLILALARKGVLDIPMLFIFNLLLPPFGLAWATPIADSVCCIMAVLYFART
ncbi:MAG: hypothetical protein IJ573_11095 [Clostridia bacterium]|nr:hypothetical protein [Clostridia bacterium]